MAAISRNNIFGERNLDMTEAPKTSAALPALVVVSGTASGLGTHIARQLVDCGVATIGVDIAPQPKALEHKLYRHAQGDVAEEKVWAAVITEINKAAPNTIGLITSAAILEVGTIIEFDRAALEKTMAANFVGTALGMRALLPLMIERGGGPIVAVASVNGTLAEQQLAVYNASKGAVRQLARTVAMDHARQGIRANVLSPGAMLAGLFERHMKSARDPEKFQATRAARQPAGKITDPGDVAKAALFLLSDASAALNGAEVIADGGLTASFDFRTGSEGASV
jgi:NAD(P)-dependent dehydrogenase (short-subunit alcohol dehydrogenase family)